MKAAWYEKTGPAAETIVVGEMPSPVAGPGEVLVRLFASGVNPSDVKARAGTRKDGTGKPYPRVIPHSDGAGIIEAVGPGVAEKRVGERVWIWNGQWGRAFGTAAQYIAIAEQQAVPLPDNVSFRTGATLGIPAVTASHCVFSQGEVSGKTVLVSGGAGTVGRLAVQFARLGGAFVIATASGEADMARARSGGAHAVIDFTQTDLAEAILAANGGRLIDRIIEVEFGVNVEVNAAVIKPRGQLVTYGSALLLRPELPFYPLMFKGILLEFVIVYLLSEEERRNAAQRINRALREEAIDMPIHAVFPLEKCAEAHQSVETPGRVGSVIVEIE